MLAFHQHAFDRITDVLSRRGCLDPTTHYPPPHNEGETTMSASENARLAEPWQALWNNDLSQTDKIIAPGFVAHAAPITGSGDDTVHGRDGLNHWVAGIHTLLNELNFEITVGPIATEDYLVVRWLAEGTYAGGFPGAPDSAIGNRVRFTGTDTLLVEHGMLAEYWANADSLLFVQQLGVRELS